MIVVGALAWLVVVFVGSWVQVCVLRHYVWLVAVGFAFLRLCCLWIAGFGWLRWRRLKDRTGWNPDHE